MRQIAGRAGRYNSRFPEGEVTCLADDDMPYLHSALAMKPVQLSVCLVFLPIRIECGLLTVL